MNGLLGLVEIRLVLVLVLAYNHFSFCWSLNHKGLPLLRSKENQCSQGHAVVLNKGKSRNVAHRKLMEVATHFPFNFPFWGSIDYVRTAPSPSPAPSLPLMVPQRAPSISPFSVPTPAMRPVSLHESFSTKNRQVLVISAVMGGSLLLIVLFTSLALCHKNKMAVVKPWTTGLSGQLQRAFVTGVPNLKRQELEIACEDFCNVVGSSSVCTLYKGILSSGIEIAVLSFTLMSPKDWSRDQESQFRKKIGRLSKVNHKNFVNLIGFCEEKDPFTRMMVFEYAPNGTLFEHLHVREAEHLDWGTRMRIIMGVAYCLGHMHQLTPPIPHKNLKSTAIHLAEDYAAKVSDFIIGDHDDDVDSTPESNVYNFGVILLEAVTGKQPYSRDNFVSDYLRGRKSIREMADPTLSSFQEEQMDGIGEVIKSCLRLSPKLRPTMRDVAGRLREITGIGPDGAIPKASPLWWAELEISSAQAV